MSNTDNVASNAPMNSESYEKKQSKSASTFAECKNISSDNLDDYSQIESTIVGVTNLLNFCDPFAVVKVETKMPDLPQVDFGTFSPLLGTKFFCFNPSSFSMVTEEINAYLSCPGAGINFDFDEVNHFWRCSETKDFETVTFAVSLHESSLKDKVFVKFHRLSGPCGVFSDSVSRFSRITAVAHSLMTVDPVDLSESSIDSAAELRSFENPKKRKGGFKALPLPLTIRQKTTTSREFISYCEVFNIWAQSDLQECLSSVLTSMPKMWKDLTIFYKTVEDMSALNMAGTEEATKEMIQMFNSMNKIYKNLFGIAVNAYSALHADDPHETVQVAADPVVVQQPAYSAIGMDYSGPGESRYDFLDFDEEDVDLSAGRVDDFHFGRDAAASNYLERQTVTMDVTKSGYRSMSVFERSESSAYAKVITSSVQVDSFNKQVKESHVSMVTSKVVIKEHDVHSLFAKLVAASAPLSTPESPAPHKLTEILASRSKEDLSRILYLTLACVCHQFSAETALTNSTFNVTQYLSGVVNHHQEFVNILHEVLADEQRPCVKKANKGHALELYNSREIAKCAQQLSADIQ